MRRHDPIYTSFYTLFFTLLSSPAFGEPTEGRLDDHVRPTSQAIHLTIDPREDDYRGSVRIQLAVEQATDQFRLHSHGHSFQRIALVGPSGDLSVELELQGEEMIQVQAEGPLTPGSYVLDLDFTAELDEPLEGLYKVERDGDAYAYTIFQPVGARRAFPCWDEPDFKIPFEVTLTVPEGNLAISASRKLETHTADGWTTVTFHPTPPLPSYGVSVAVGPFDTLKIEGLSVPGRIVTTRGRSQLASIAAGEVSRMLNALEEYFGQPYPYDKLDLLAVPGFPSGGVENPAAIVFSEDSLLLDPNAPPAQRWRNPAVLMAHELSHMWFGNLVTLKWWNDVWLNESFATWISYKITDELYPELRVDALKLRHGERAFELDAQASAPPIRREFESPHEAFTVSAPLTYQKGSKILEMIESWVGEEAFREGIHAYFKAHAWDNAEAADFWRAIDRSAGQDVSARFAKFIEQPGYPLIDVELEDGHLHWSQERFVHHGKSTESLRWDTPISFKLIHGLKTQAGSYLLTGQPNGSEPSSEHSFALAADKHSPDLVFPNAAASGYYRWSLPEPQLKALAARASEVLTSSERLDLISNIGSLLAAGKLTGDVYLEILKTLADDPDPVVVSAVVDALDEAKVSLVDASLSASYADFLRQALTPAWDRLGIEPQPQESEMDGSLRAKLYRTLGRAGQVEDLRSHARRTVDAFLAPTGDEAANAASGPQTLMAPALQVAALSADRQLFEAFRDQLRATSNPGSRRQLIRTLGSMGDDQLRHAALNLFLEGEIDPGELVDLAFTLRHRDGGDAVVAWLVESHDDLVTQLPSFLRAFLPLFAGGCSADRLATAQAFFGQEKHRVAGTERQMAQVTEQVTDCVRLRERERAAVARYLSRSDLQVAEVTSAP